MAAIRGALYFMFLVPPADNPRSDGGTPSNPGPIIDHILAIDLHAKCQACMHL